MKGLLEVSVLKLSIIFKNFHHKCRGNTNKTRGNNNRTPHTIYMGNEVLIFHKPLLRIYPKDITKDICKDGVSKMCVTVLNLIIKFASKMNFQP